MYWGGGGEGGGRSSTYMLAHTKTGTDLAAELVAEAHVRLYRGCYVEHDAPCCSDFRYFRFVYILVLIYLYACVVYSYMTTCVLCVLWSTNDTSIKYVDMHNQIMFTRYSPHTSVSAPHTSVSGVCQAQSR